MHPTTSRARPWRDLAVLVLPLLLVACGDEATAPPEAARDAEPGAPSFIVQLSCAVDVKAGTMACGSATVSGVVGGAARAPLIVGSQHRFVRLANDTPKVEDDVWSANVTVQNLTLQPFGTEDGATAEGTGVRVFFVDEPSNGVEVLNHDGVASFLGSAGTEKYYQYSGTALEYDGILSPGEVSRPKQWRFGLNGAETFGFSVLVATTVPDPDAIGVHLTQVAAGYEHTCGVDEDGKAYCWGNGNHGQLGIGANVTRTTPAPVRMPEDVTFSRLVAGAFHTCGEGSDGTVYCWGRNYYGQIGDGTISDRSTPVAVNAPEGVTLSRLTAGSYHTCAEGDDDRVYCWGYNHFGQLGDGTDTTRLEPVAVSAPEGVRLSAPAAGSYMTCAEGTDGGAWCWGRNYPGQLGDSTYTERRTPVRVHAPHGVAFTGLTAGDGHACAQGSNLAVYCWGSGSYGQLGNGSVAVSPTPVPVHAPKGVILTDVVAGENHTCARGSDGRAWCWGHNASGQLGDGTTKHRSEPVVVLAPGDHGLSRITLGSYHTCARSTDGLTYCWGRNLSGRLGDGTTQDRHTPVPIAATRRP